jgi:arabinose-5-phosphate isomerase
MKSLFDFYQVALEVLHNEYEAIKKVSENLSAPNFNKACQLILNTKGKIVLAGVGKSGIIAHKIAATMASTGTLAINLSVADALHGDLGMVSKNDLIILLSNSGETPEILALLPHLKSRNLPIIAIAGKPYSSLALASDVFLNASIEKEACPLNLAPTTSTTVALAIGDAIAIALMKAKEIREEDFAVNHPAGKLGQRLSLKISDIMQSPFPTALISDDINTVLQKITLGKAGMVVVQDDLEQMQGIITDGDIRRFFEKNQTLINHQAQAKEIMTSKPTVVHEHIFAYQALQLMEKGNSQISVLPVVSTENTTKVIGIVRIHDILGKL